MNFPATKNLMKGRCSSLTNPVWFCVALNCPKTNIKIIFAINSFQTMLTWKLRKKNSEKRKLPLFIEWNKCVCVCVYIYIHIFVLVGRAFARGSGYWGSLLDRVISKTKKIVFDTALLYTQHYNVRVKGKVEQSREKISPLPYTSV